MSFNNLLNLQFGPKGVQLQPPNIGNAPPNFGQRQPKPQQGNPFAMPQFGAPFGLAPQQQHYPPGRPHPVQHRPPGPPPQQKQQQGGGFLNGFLSLFTQLAPKIIPGLGGTLASIGMNLLRVFMR